MGFLLVGAFLISRETRKKKAMMSYLAEKVFGLVGGKKLEMWWCFLDYTFLIFLVHFSLPTYYLFDNVALAMRAILFNCTNTFVSLLSTNILSICLRKFLCH